MDAWVSFRLDDCEYDDYYEEDTWEFLKKPFEPLIARVAPGRLSLPTNGRPNLSWYLFPQRICCTLGVVNDKAQPQGTSIATTDGASRVL